jgi:hypothetical protein
LLSWFEICGLAREAGAKFPELVAAQYALESGWGKYQSGKNNFFGLKGPGTKKQTTEFVNGKPVSITDEFKDFASPQECVQYLVDKWYKDYKGYKGVNNASTRDEAARMLVSQGYATDPKYAEKLIGIMNSNSAPTAKTASNTPDTISLKAAAKWYTEQPHQNEAWDYLQSVLSPAQLTEFAKRYRKPVAPAKPKFPLKVPYFYQRDSKTGQGERSCQSSAIAMVLEYMNPSLIGDDDDYLRLVMRYGDTVSQAAHVKALNHLGVKNSFRTNGRVGDIIRLLDLGIPVPIGILHRGSLARPSGGGHYITIIGYDAQCFHVHDPFGELDLVNGGYPKNGPTDGKNQRYSRTNVAKRWLISSQEDGWYWSFEGNKFPQP